MLETLSQFLLFLTQTVVSAISANKGNSEEILLEVISAIFIFDTTYSGDKEYKEKVEIVCEPLLAWLYVAIKAPIDEGVMKVETQPCAKIDLVDSLK